MKIKCEICGEYGYLQKLGNYYRVRHYNPQAQANNKYAFYYHKQTVAYAEAQLKALKSKGLCSSNLEHNVKSCGRDGKTNKPKTSTESKIKSGRSLVWLGHQPATLTTRVQIPATAPTTLERVPLPFKQVKTRLSRLGGFCVYGGLL